MIWQIFYKVCPEWVVVAQHRGEILHYRNAKIVERYNEYTHNLPPVTSWWHRSDPKPTQSQMEHNGKNHHCPIRSPIPNQGWWIRKDPRNRHFLRKCELKPAPTPIPSATPGPITPSGNAPLLHLYPPTSSGNGIRTTIEPPKQIAYTSPRLRSSRIPQALSKLLPHNRPGLNEGYRPHTIWPICGRGASEGRCTSHCSNMLNKQEE